MKAKLSVPQNVLRDVDVLQYFSFREYSEQEVGLT